MNSDLMKRAQLSRDASRIILAQKQKLAALEAKVAQFETEARVAKLANTMVEKGHITSDALESTTERLKEAASQGRLDVLEEAITLRGDDLWGKTASASDSTLPGNYRNPLHAYLLRERTLRP